MALHFHPLAIKEIKKQTADCVSVTFDIPEALLPDFTFVQGQNITLKTIIEGEEIRRSYSICTAPFENELTVAIKKIYGGKFSTHANGYLQKGDIIEVMPPTGKFNTALNSTHQKNYLAFAAGSGITPILSIIKTTLYEEPQSSFTLVFCNRDKASIIFFEELEALKNKYLQRFNLINLLTREKTDADIFFGRIDAEKLSQLNKLIDYKKQDDVFICGPESMIFLVKEFLEKQGLHQQQIHFELFTAAGSQSGSSTVNTTVAIPEANSNVQVTVDGRTVSFDMPFNGSSILDAAMKQGADLPYACKGGMCCTCKAKLVAGQVKMDVNWGLEPEEVEQGFILTCQAHPVTDKVVVDFDQR
jgi:ring-1,2-phenylacetyl-CoA epoxidase subunit PaaE